MKERGALMYVYVWEHIVSLYYRTAWWMFTKLGRDEVLMVPHLRLGFLARFAQRWIQGGTKIGQWGVPSLEDFFFRSECNSNKPNASSYPELKYSDCLLFGLISQIWQSFFLINHLLTNLILNSRAHCTQVSDQCPLGLLLNIRNTFSNFRNSFSNIFFSNIKNYRFFTLAWYFWKYLWFRDK